MSCELGRKLHRSVLFYIENYHGADDGAERPQKHTRYVTVNAERCLSHTANFSYKCVHPAVRLESMASCYHELAAVLFVCVMMEKKTSHSPFPPPPLCHGQHQNTLRINDFNAFRFSLFWLLRFLSLK